jgi:threonine dehydrogenase-like Zn-dependent dehydrogenase
MKAAIFKGKGKIELGERPNPRIQEPTDAVVRVVYGCVCGSDLWYYRGINPHKVGSIGHEFIGVVEEVGTEVKNIKEGDFVVAPFQYSDGTCVNCKAGVPTSCLRGGIAPARLYIPDLLPDVLSSKIDPGLVFDFETDLEHIKEAYDAMDQRRAIKSLIRVTSI